MNSLPFFFIFIFSLSQFLLFSRKFSNRRTFLLYQRKKYFKLTNVAKLRCLCIRGARKDLHDRFVHGDDSRVSIGQTRAGLVLQDTGDLQTGELAVGIGADEV